MKKIVIFWSLLLFGYLPSVAAVAEWIAYYTTSANPCGNQGQIVVELYAYKSITKNAASWYYQSNYSYPLSAGVLKGDGYKGGVVPYNHPRIVVFNNTSTYGWQNETNGRKENPSAMFRGITSLQFVRRLNIAINTYTTNTQAMFKGCTGLKDLGNEKAINFSSCNMSKITTVDSMFYSCSSLTSIPNLGSMTTSALTKMNSTFQNCSGLTALELTSWNPTKLTTWTNVFSGCSNLVTLNMGGWTSIAVTSMEGTFQNLSKLKTLVVKNNLNVSKVSTMANAFSGCTALKESAANTSSFDLRGWNTSALANMSNTFYNCSALTLLNLSGWNTTKLTNMSNTFYNCKGLASLDLHTDAVNGYWVTSSLANLTQTFYNCTGLTSLNVSGWNTAGVTTMNGTFMNCSKLPSIDITSWNTANVTTMANMFNGCSSLKSITFGQGFSTEKVTASANMFAKCPKLRYIDFYDSNHTAAITSVDRDSENGMFSGVPKTTVIYLPKKSTNITDKTNVVYSNEGDSEDLRCPKYYSSDQMSLTVPSGYTYSQDQTDVEIPHSFRTNEAVYVRTMTAGATIGTAILPFDFASNDSIVAYQLVSNNAEGKKLFRSAEVVPANTPFVFKVKKARIDGTAHFRMNDESGEFGITVHEVQTTNAAEGGSPYEENIEFDDWSVKGYYVNETVTDYANTFYINRAGTQFCRATGNLTLYPHRVIFQGPSNGAKLFDVEFVDDNDIVNAIETPELDGGTEQTQPQTIYDAGGRIQKELRRGINIVRMSDGTVRKVIIK